MGVCRRAHFKKEVVDVAEEDEIREVTIDCLISQEHRSTRRPFPSLLVRDSRT